MKKNILSIIITLVITFCAFGNTVAYAAPKYMIKAVNTGEENFQALYQGFRAAENTDYVFSFDYYAESGAFEGRISGNTFNVLRAVPVTIGKKSTFSIEYNRGTDPTGGQTGDNKDLAIVSIDNTNTVGIMYIWNISLTVKGSSENLLVNPNFENGNYSGWNANPNCFSVLPFDTELCHITESVEDCVYDSNLNAVLENKKKSIINSSSGITNSGTVYEVKSGNTIPSSVKSGDTVLFQRNGVYKYPLILKSGVQYGAYGVGEKPLFDASYTTQWADNSNNIWISTGTFNADVGLILLDETSALAAVKKSSINDLSQNNDFYYDYSSKKIYFYSDKNPASIYPNAKICLGGCISSGGSGENIIIDNISFKYGGGHGIAFENGAANITIQNCEFGFIGGAYSGEGSFVRYGNAIQFFDGCNNINVINNYVYQIYDTGITHQSCSSTVQSNILFSGNYVTHCSMAFEIFASSDAVSQFSNITYQDNILAYSGYGWGKQRPSNEPPSLICFWSGNNPCKNVSNYVIRDNTFAYSSDCLIRLAYHDTDLGIDFIGNKYYQTKGLAFDWVNSQKLKSNNEYAFKYSVSKVDSNPSAVVYTDVDYNKYIDDISYSEPTWNKAIIVSNKEGNNDNWQSFGKKISVTAQKTYVFTFNYFAPAGCEFEARIESAEQIKNVAPLNTNKYSQSTLEYTAENNEDIYFLINNGSSAGMGYVWDIKISDKATGQMLSYTNSDFGYNGLYDWFASSEKKVLTMNKKYVASFKLSTYDLTVKILKYADIDRDGFLNASDIIDLKKSLLGINLGYENLDVNNDKCFDVRDMVAIKKMIANFET